MVQAGELQVAGPLAQFPMPGSRATRRTAALRDRATPRHDSISGFTLLETMVVLILIGVATAIVAPNMVLTTGSHRVVEEARRVHARLAEARSQAIARQRDTRVIVAGGDMYSVSVLDDDGSWVALGESNVTPTGLGLTIDEANAGEIRFQPQGRVDAARTLVISDADHEQTIRVLAGGLVRWQGRSK